MIEAIGKPPLDVLFELLIENGGSVPTVFFHHSEEDMRYALAAAVRLDRLGRPGRHDRRPARRRPSAPALLRHVPARARALCPRGARAHARGRGTQDDLGQRGKGPRLRSRAARGRDLGRRDDLRRRARHRPRDVRAAAPVRHRRRVRDRQRQRRPRSRPTHACAGWTGPVRTGAGTSPIRRSTRACAARF